jgi:hypothetical protein
VLLHFPFLLAVDRGFQVTQQWLEVRVFGALRRAEMFTQAFAINVSRRFGMLRA